MIFYSKMLILNIWRQYKHYKNAADACIPISNIEFRFIRKISSRYFFSGRVVGIKSNDKRKYKFDENGDIHNYTLDQLQAYSTKQTALYNKNNKKISSNNGIDGYNEGNGDDANDANEPPEQEQESGVAGTVVLIGIQKK